MEYKEFKIPTKKELDIFLSLIEDIKKSDLNNNYVIWDRLVEKRTKNNKIIKDKFYNLLDKINSSPDYLNKFLNTDINNIQKIWDEC